MLDISTFNIWIAIALFFIYFILDAINSYFTIKVVETNPVCAASAGSSMHFFIALGVCCYVNNFLYLIPMIMGSWTGIFCLLTYRRYNDIEIDIDYDDEEEELT